MPPFCFFGKTGLLQVKLSASRLLTDGRLQALRGSLHKPGLCHPERSRRVPFRVGIFAVADSNINGMSGGHPLRGGSAQTAVLSF